MDDTWCDILRRPNDLWIGRNILKVECQSKYDNLDSIKCHTFPGMGDRTLKDTSRTIQFYFCAKGLIHPGSPLKRFYCALQWHRIWFYGQSDAKLWNLRTSKSTWHLARAAVSSSDNLNACLAADLCFKEIHVDARACKQPGGQGLLLVLRLVTNLPSQVKQYTYTVTIVWLTRMLVV